MTPQIQIQQTLGQIGLRYQPQSWQIHTQQADLSIQSPAAEVNIQTTPDQLSIDQTQAFADEGLRAPLAFSQYEAQKAHQAALQGISSSADWGHKFLHTEKGNPFSQWVMRHRGNIPQLSPSLVPGPFSVQVHVTLGQVQIQANPQPVHVDAILHSPTVQFQPGQVQTYVAQQASVQITPPPVGQLVNVQA